MNKKVTIYVWNYFTNDARVMRSATALVEVGYKVELIAIRPANKILPKKEAVQTNFNLTRVESSFNFLKRNIHFLLFFVAIVAIFLLYLVSIHPLVGLGCCVVGYLIYKKRKYTRIVLIFSQMVCQGLMKPCDIVHSNDLNTLLQAVIIKKIKKAKLVYDSHEIHTSRTGYNSPWYEKIEGYLLKYVDLFIHENETRAQYIEKLYGRRPNVLHNYPTEKKIKASQIDLHDKLSIPSEVPILLYQGGIQIGRGLEQLIDAMPMIKKGVLVFIGDGKIKQDLKNQVLKKGLSPRVKFIDKVSLNQLHEYTLNAYLGFQMLNNVCYNHYSASSNKFFEYMMAGVPVIACDFPEMQKVMNKWHTGLLVDSHSPEAIANAVNYLIENTKDYQKMKQNSIKARDVYNWTNEKKTLVGYYQQLNKTNKVNL